MRLECTAGGHMDPYDAIVEQLEGAREQGLESVKDRLGGILESLDQVSSSIREAMSVSADDLLPLGEIPAAMAELRLAAEEAAAVPPPTVTLEMLRGLDGARSQSDILHGLLSALTGHAARAVVLVFRPDEVSAWSAIGFDDVSQLERWSCGRKDSPLFDGFPDDPKPLGFAPADDPVIQRWLEGEAAPDEALLVPISLRGKTMGAVYVDRLADAPWNPEAVQILVAISCWMIDTLKYRTASSSPILAEIAEAAFVADEVEEEAAEEVVAQEEGAAGDELDEPIEGAVDDEVVDEGTPTEQELEAGEKALGEMASEPDFDPSATVQVDPSTDLVEEAVEEPEPPSAELKPEAAEDEAKPEVEEAVEAEEAVEPESHDAAGFESPSETPRMPMPPPVQPVVPPAVLGEAPALGGEPPTVEAEEDSPQLTAEDESQHEEARRFARLLVSEIKLYNEDAVERGREQNDLSTRLKEDIDRSREMYERRIPAEIRTSRDYFHEELVRILADGDAAALGM